MPTRARRLAAILLVSLAALSLGAAEPEVPFSLKWESVEGAGGYKVEIATLDEAVIASTTVERAEATIEVPPGTYLVRITTLNRFMRPEASTPWKKVTLVRKKNPVATKVEPSAVEPGAQARMIVTGRYLDADTKVSVSPKAGGKAVQALSTRALTQGRLEIVLPPLFQIGVYSLELVNPPDHSLVLPGAFTVKHKDPVIASVTPPSVSVLETGARITISGSEFAPGAAIRLEGEGRSIAIEPESSSGTSIEAALPPAATEGGYDLVIENDALATARAKAALRVFMPSPHIISVEPAEMRTDSGSRRVSVAAAELGPALSASLTLGDTRIGLKLLDLTEGGFSFELPEGLAAGGYGLELSNAPKARSLMARALTLTEPPPPEIASTPPPEPPREAEPVAPAPEAAASPEPEKTEPEAREARSPQAETTPSVKPRKEELVIPAMELSAGWAYRFTFGQWADMYPSSLLDGEIRLRSPIADLGFGKLPGKPLSLGVQLEADFARYATTADQATYAASTMYCGGLSLGPFASLALPPFRIGLSGEAGLVLSSVEVSDATLGSDAIRRAYSIDASASGKLEAHYSFNSRLSLGLSAEYKAILYKEATMHTIAAGVLVAFEL